MEFFGLATGWLGWTPEVALHTPIPQIDIALAARIDWVRKTNPFGSGETDAKVKTTEAQQPVAERLASALRAKGAKRASR